MTNTIQDQGANFRGKDNRLFLVRCYVCAPGHGRENYAPAVANGICLWCGWNDPDNTSVTEQYSTSVIASSNTPPTGASQNLINSVSSTRSHTQQLTGLTKTKKKRKMRAG